MGKIILKEGDNVTINSKDLTSQRHISFFISCIAENTYFVEKLLS